MRWSGLRVRGWRLGGSCWLVVDVVFIAADVAVAVTLWIVPRGATRQPSMLYISVPSSLEYAGVIVRQSD